MKKRNKVWIGTGLVVAIGVAVGLTILSRPPDTSAAAAPEIGPDEIAATLAALKPPKRQRPVIAVIGINDATETTDYVMPTGILRRADVADVLMVATGPGPVKLYPALTVEPDVTVTEFDSRHPDGADYVIVPAMIRDDDPAALQWIKGQAGKGATVIGVCVGVKVVAEAGLLDNKRGTTHWYVLKELREKHPSMQYVPNRRLVVDRGVATTTGITASMPMSLTLIEAIAGRDKAEAVAKDLGLDHWDARHASARFRLTLPFALTVMANRAALWNREQLSVEVAPGIDEALDAALSNIETRYGPRTRYVVAMQLEYPRL